MVVENLDQKIAELDQTVSEAGGSKPIDWKGIIYNPPEIVVADVGPEVSKEQAYFLVKHTCDEVQESRRDVFYDGVERWTGIQDHQDKHTAEIIEISKRLKSRNDISVEEKDTIVNFLDPGADGFTSMPHTWFWLTIGKPQPAESHYFSPERNRYEVPATAVRNMLMFEIGAFFNVYCHLNDEARIGERLQKMYPEERVREDYDFWVKYITHSDNRISEKMYRQFSVHQWLWQTYHNVLVNRLFNPKLDFTEFVKPEIFDPSK